MVIRKGEDSIEVVAVERVSDHLPTPGDTRLEVAVQSCGFGGRGSAWVEASRMRSFVRHLRELEARRQGKAELVSMSPGEFVLRVGAANRRGHMAVTGRLSRHFYTGEDGPYLHVVQFGFEFDPTSLPEIVSAFKAIADDRA
jgi:hypothetical protein